MEGFAIMRVLITPVESEDGQEIRSLYRWLSNDAAVAKRMKLHIEPVNDQLGSMGGASDAITAMFADGSAVAAIGSLFVSYRTWRDTRRMPPALKIEKDGVTVLLNS